MRQRFNAMLFRVSVCLFCAALLTAIATPACAQLLTSSDLSGLRSVGSAAISPDGRYIAYSITMRDRPGRPYGQLWVMDVSRAKSVRLGGDKPASAPLWSNDSKWIAFRGEEGDKHGLLIAHPDGSGTIFLTALAGTNSPLPERGKDVAWSPDGKQIAFVSSTPGEGSDEASGDPMVITRYLYKPDYTEGMTRFNDNQRLHIFVVDTASKQVRQLTRGNYDEHSIDWSPDGKQLVFASNREPNQDEFFNYDLFTLQLADNSIHRLTATESCEYDPLWSPDGKFIAYRGTRRGLTDRETTMEDTHVWMMNADGSNRREIGSVIDNRQGAPQWAQDASAVYFTVQERGSNNLVRLPVSGGQPEYMVKEAGGVGGWSVGKNRAVAYGFTSPRDAAELYYKSGTAAARKLTDLNQELLAGKSIADVESFTFVSNDNRFEVEAFLTEPVGVDVAATS